MSTNPKRFLGITWHSAEGITAFMAVYAAIPSTWIFIVQQREERPQIFVRMDVEQLGTTQDDSAACNIAIVFSNIGKKTIFLAPYVRVLTFDASYDPATEGKPWATTASFPSADSGANARRKAIPGMPVAIEPGKEAMATTRSIKAPLPLLNGISHNFVYFNSAWWQRIYGRLSEARPHQDHGQ